jgi:hypothetical protein
MDRVWSTITNPDALSINKQWVGHPGTLVKAYPAISPDKMAIQTTCSSGTVGGSGSGVGWSLKDGKLIAPKAGESVVLGVSLCPYFFESTHKTTFPENAVVCRNVTDKRCVCLCVYVCVCVCVCVCVVGGWVGARLCTYACGCTCTCITRVCESASDTLPHRPIHQTLKHA